MLTFLAFVPRVRQGPGEPSTGSVADKRLGAPCRLARRASSAREATCHRSEGRRWSATTGNAGGGFLIGALARRGAIVARAAVDDRHRRPFSLAVGQPGRRNLQRLGKPLG